MASDQIRMSLTELGIPQSILTLIDAPISYLTNFVTPIDRLMAPPVKNLSIFMCSNDAGKVSLQELQSL